MILFIYDFVGNKAKGRISKRVFQENKTRQMFRKRNVSYPLILTRTKKIKQKAISYKSLHFEFHACLSLNLMVHQHVHQLTLC